LSLNSAAKYVNREIFSNFGKKFIKGGSHKFINILNKNKFFNHFKLNR